MSSSISHSEWILKLNTPVHKVQSLYLWWNTHNSWVQYNIDAYHNLLGCMRINQLVLSKCLHLWIKQKCMCLNKLDNVINKKVINALAGKVYLEYYSLLFQMMITLRRHSPLFIQEDMSMHSALSFHKRECRSDMPQIKIFTWNVYCNSYSYVLCVTDMQTSGYLVRRKAWQCALLGEGWAAQAVASAHEDQERVHCLWTHWHQHSSPAGECLHNSYPLIYHWFINAVLKNDQSSHSCILKCCYSTLHSLPRQELKKRRYAAGFAPQVQSP